mmetsp:Transcript_29379/g.78941  ORF Transcript_29379/g.78941 Transcript_29379/m.78941 type:complete len:232 (-) Transcript_29379:66-761(-)
MLCDVVLRLLFEGSERVLGSVILSTECHGLLHFLGPLLLLPLELHRGRLLRALGLIAVVSEELHVLCEVAVHLLEKIFLVLRLGDRAGVRGRLPATRLPLLHAILQCGGDLAEDVIIYEPVDFRTLHELLVLLEAISELPVECSSSLGQVPISDRVLGLEGGDEAPLVVANRVCRPHRSELHAGAPGLRGAMLGLRDLDRLDFLDFCVVRGGGGQGSSRVELIAVLIFVHG